MMLTTRHVDATGGACNSLNGCPLIGISSAKLRRDTMTAVGCRAVGSARLGSSTLNCSFSRIELPNVQEIYPRRADRSSFKILTFSFDLHDGLNTQGNFFIFSKALDICNDPTTYQLGIIIRMNANEPFNSYLQTIFFLIFGKSSSDFVTLYEAKLSSIQRLDVLLL